MAFYAMEGYGVKRHRSWVRGRGEVQIRAPFEQNPPAAGQGDVAGQLRLFRLRVQVQWTEAPRSTISPSYDDHEPRALMMRPLSVLDECLVQTTEDGERFDVDAGKLAGLLGARPEELATLIGLPSDVMMKPHSVKSSLVQTRLRDLAEILDRVLPWSDSLQQALDWVRSEPLPSFGGRTAEDLVKAGHADAVKKHIDRIALGGYA